MTRPPGGSRRRSGHAAALTAATGDDTRGATRRIPGGRSTGSPPPAAGYGAAAREQRARHWRAVGWPLAVGTVGLAGMLVSGVPAWRAALIATGVAVALWLTIISAAARRPDWPVDAPDLFFQVRMPWHVPGLTAAHETGATFEHYLRPRLWAVACELLERRGIDPASERAERLMGPREYALLTGADTRPAHITRSVSELCLCIARLAVTIDGDSGPALGNPALAGLAGRQPRRTGRGDSRAARLHLRRTYP